MQRIHAKLATGLPGVEAVAAIAFGISTTPHAQGQQQVLVIQGVVVIITLMTLVANVITDISYAFIDPRIRID